MEAQLRDVAFLMILALLFVLTLQILWLTSDEGAPTPSRGRMTSADTVNGPSLGIGRQPLEALMHALEPFDRFVLDELLKTVPDELFWASR